jgi:hypothetical protein
MEGGGRGHGTAVGVVVVGDKGWVSVYTEFRRPRRPDFLITCFTACCTASHFALGLRAFPAGATLFFWCNSPAAVQT